jgi:hypothetical protein
MKNRNQRHQERQLFSLKPQRILCSTVEKVRMRAGFLSSIIFGFKVRFPRNDSRLAPMNRLERAIDQTRRTWKSSPGGEDLGEGERYSIFGFMGI